MITVALADDQALVRAGFRLILDVEDGIEVVGEAEDGMAAIRLSQERRPDVLLMDIRMPVLDGIGATRDDRSIRPGVRQAPASSSHDVRCTTSTCTRRCAPARLVSSSRTPAETS